MTTLLPSAPRPALTLSAGPTEGELIYSIEAMELRFTYEPIIRMADWLCVGAEAMVSWRHPRRGLIAGELVMPFVERMPRRVAMVTEVILDEATASCRRWRDEGRPFGVWVRLPAVLRQPDLAERALRILRSYRLPPDALTIQLSLEPTRVPAPSPEESAASLRAAEIRVAFDHGASPRAVVPHAAPLCEVGVSVSQAQDDAGPGGAASHWAGIVSDARRRGYATVCRGISSREAWAAAEAAGCDLAQGAFIARAVPGPEFARWMRRWMPSTRQ